MAIWCSARTARTAQNEVNVSKSNNRAIKKKEKRNRLHATRLANQGGAETNLADFALVIVI